MTSIEEKTINKSFEGNVEERYRFQCSIIEVETGEIVVRGSTYLSKISPAGECESVDMEVASVLRAFRRIQDKEKVDEIALDDHDER